jgi:hypothetical protein
VDAILDWVRVHGQDGSYGSMAVLLGAIWLVLGLGYAAWWAWPRVAPLLRAIGRRVEPRVEQAARRRHGVEAGGAKLGMCGRCRSIYRLGLGACYACGAPASEAVPIPPAESRDR